MHLSDGHHDQVVVPDQVGGWKSTTSRSVRPCRAVRQHRRGMDPGYLGPEVLLPCALGAWPDGDYTSGEIHKACERSYYRNQFKNCLAIGQLHALMYRDLAAHFEEVNVLYLAGNHGRRTPKKDYLGAHDNWDYLCGEVARLHCRDLGNVHFSIPDAWSANVNINGVGFNVSHGDDVRFEPGPPVVRSFRRAKGLDRLGGGGRRGQRCRYFCSRASPMPPASRRTWMANCWSTALGSEPIHSRTTRAVRLPRAIAMAARRQPQAWHHLADELQAAP